MPRRDLGGSARAGIATAGTARGVAVSASPRDEVELLHRVARGDRAAFGELYDRLAPTMLALAYRMLGAQREAEDLVHDVFIECWQSAGQYDQTRGSVRAWFLVRTRSRALDRLRSARRAAAVPLDEALLGQLAAHSSESAGQEGGMLQRLLLQLSSEQRVVVELGYFAGYSCAEIADALAIPAGTVKSRMSRALERLRVLLQGYEGAHP
jgi:RNA polymerase sigma-70 factor, ECF subfamily